MGNWMMADHSADTSVVRRMEEKTMKPPALVDFRGPRELEAWKRITGTDDRLPDDRLPDDHTVDVVSIFPRRKATTA